MSRRCAPRWGLLRALAPLRACDRVVNRDGRGDERACELDYTAACLDRSALACWAATNPAELFTQGSNPAHFVESDAALRRACDGGQWPACNDLAVGIRNGRFVGTTEAAEALLRGACERGVRAACEGPPGDGGAPPARRRRRRRHRDEG